MVQGIQVEDRTGMQTIPECHKTVVEGLVLPGPCFAKRPDVPAAHNKVNSQCSSIAI